GEAVPLSEPPREPRRLPVARVAGDDHFLRSDWVPALRGTHHAVNPPHPGHQPAAVDLVAEELVHSGSPGSVLVVERDFLETALRDAITPLGKEGERPAGRGTFSTPSEPALDDHRHRARGVLRPGNTHVHRE